MARQNTDPRRLLACCAATVLVLTSIGPFATGCDSTPAAPGREAGGDGGSAGADATTAREGRLSERGAGPVTLAVTKTGAGSGTVTSAPAGIDCGASCSATFDAGTSVTLTASAADGSAFAGWSGDCTGGAPTCTLALTHDATVTATFALAYYLSPAGSDSDAGTSAAPWKTFGFAIPKLKPGYALVLKDGTYTGANSKYLNVDCSATPAAGAQKGVNGTAAAPILIRAENERQAFIKDDGSVAGAVLLAHCSYWNLEGLHIENSDNTTLTWARSVIELEYCDHVTLRRNLIANPTHKFNSGIVGVDYSSNVLLEENEAYNFHKHGVTFYYSGGAGPNIARRNYCNSRSTADSGYATEDPARGDECFFVFGYAPNGYPPSSRPTGGPNVIIENNISENDRALVKVEPGGYGPSDGTKILGNISIGDTHLALIRARGTYMPKDTTLSNNVAVQTSANSCEDGGCGMAFPSMSAKTTSYDQCTAIIKANNLTGFAAIQDNTPAGGPTCADCWPAPGDGKYSVTYANSLVVGNGTEKGFYVNAGSGTCTVSGSDIDAFNAATPFSGLTLSNSKTLDPKLGTCLAWLPDASPMKGAGAGGKDIGANVLYRYDNGVLAKAPLWDRATGEFPHGALVKGLNDIAGQSAFDVHKRLNVNTNGCSFPGGY